MDKVARIQNTPLSALPARLPERVARTAPVQDVLRLFQSRRAECALVMDGDRLAGIVSDHDVAMRVGGGEVSLGSPVDEVMTAIPDCLYATDTVGSAIRLMNRRRFRHVPILDAADRAVRVLSVSEIVEFVAEHFPDEIYNLPPKSRQRALDADGG